MPIPRIGVSVPKKRGPSRTKLLTPKRDKRCSRSQMIMSGLPEGPRIEFGQRHSRTGTLGASAIYEAPRGAQGSPLVATGRAGQQSQNGGSPRALFANVFFPGHGIHPSQKSLARDRRVGLLAIRQIGR